MRSNLNVEIIEPEQFHLVLSYMRNPNDVFASKGSFYRVADEMILDAKIGSHVRLRKDIVASFPFYISQGKSSDVVYEFVRDNFSKNLNWEHDVREFLTAIEYGFSFSELLWRLTPQGYWIPDSLRNKKPEIIGFKTEIVTTNEGKRSEWIPVLLKDQRLLTEKKRFLVYRNNPRAENPYGTSDLLMCYWAWQFKKLGWEFWLYAARKAGVPSLAALFDAPDKIKAQETADAISESLSDLEGGSGIALANVKELIPLTMSGVLADHKVLIDTCNQEISFALTTQSLSTQEGVFGTRAQATVHDENLVRVCHGDAKALQGVFQTIIDWMVELNFGKDEISPKGEFDLKQYATLDEVLKAIQVKVPVSKESLYTRYGLPRPKDADDAFILSNEDIIALSDTLKKNDRKPARIF